MFSHKYQQVVKIGTRLMLAFGLMFAYCFAVFAFALYGERALHDTLQRNDSNLMRSLQTLRTVLQNVDTTRRDETSYLTTTSPSEMTAMERGLIQAQSQVGASLEGNRDPLSDAEERADYEKMLSQTQEYFRLQGQVLALARDRDNPAQREAAQRLWIGDSHHAFFAVHDTAQAWLQHDEALASDAVGKGEALYVHDVTGLSVVICLALLGAVMSAVRITGSITRPLHRAVALAKSVADGDLTKRIEVTGTDELCELFDTLNEMSSELAGLVSDVLRSAEGVRVTASEIAKSNEELSQRTQQQAASLEETASSMEQITSLGKSNSNNAGNAAKLARKAHELAESGGGVAAQAVVAMGVINEGSDKISNIISVIDDIAFQTNLLALNAAVEAARAGEQGRGFAVVASEVRGLAQRSAEAAKQIKALINDSAYKVRAGTELVDRSGQALSQIQSSVREMTDLITEIANSSHEQADGVQRINEAILHLDGATQQNAALVEQGTAASRTLQDQADTLSRRASTFTVEQSAAHHNAVSNTRAPARANRQPESLDALAKPPQGFRKAG